MQIIYKSSIFNWKFIKKTLAAVLAGVFLFTNTFSWAQEEKLFLTGMGNTSSSGPANTSKLAPKLFLANAEKRAELQAALICDLIEKNANYGKKIDEVNLRDLLLWKGAKDRAFDNCTFQILPGEIRINIPQSNLSVRYYDPQVVGNALPPYSDVRDLKTRPIGPSPFDPARLQRQIIYRVRALPEPRSEETSKSPSRIFSMFSDMKENPGSDYKNMLGVLLEKAAHLDRPFVLEIRDEEGNLKKISIYRKNLEGDYDREDIKTKDTKYFDLLATEGAVEVAEVRLSKDNLIIGVTKLSYETDFNRVNIEMRDIRITKVLDELKKRLPMYAEFIDDQYELGYLGCKEMVYKYDGINCRYRILLPHFIDEAFRKVRQKRGYADNTRMVFLKAGAEPLAEIARVMARIDKGRFPESAICSVWGTMGNYKAVKEGLAAHDPTQAAYFLKYLHDHGVLGPNINNILFVDTDSRIGSRYGMVSRTGPPIGTELLIYRTLLNRDAVNEANKLFGRDGYEFSCWNEKNGVRSAEMFYMYIDPDTVKLPEFALAAEGISGDEQKEYDTRMNVSSFNHGIDLKITRNRISMLWAKVDDVSKTESVDEEFILKDDGTAGLRSRKPYRQPNMGVRLEIQNVLEYAGFVMGTLDFMEAQGFDVSEEAERYFAELGRKFEEISGKNRDNISLSKMQEPSVLTASAFEDTTKPGSLHFLGKILGIRYTSYFHAPVIEELFKIGGPLTLSAIVERLHPGWPVLNTLVFTTFLAVFGVTYIILHTLNERAPPEEATGIKDKLKFYYNELKSIRSNIKALTREQKLNIFRGPFLIAVSGIIMSMIFITDPSMTLMSSMLAHLVIDVGIEHFKNNDKTPPEPGTAAYQKNLERLRSNLIKDPGSVSTRDAMRSILYEAGIGVREQVSDNLISNLIYVTRELLINPIQSAALLKRNIKSSYGVEMDLQDVRDIYILLRRLSVIQDLLTYESARPRALSVFREFLALEPARIERILGGEITPLALEIHPSPRCNFRCAHCFNATALQRTGEVKIKSFAAAVSPEEKERALGLISQYIASGVDKIYLSGGGEPFMEDLHSYIDHIRKTSPDIYVSINTNGELLTERDIALCVAKVNRLFFSMDAATSRTLGRLKGIEDSESEARFFRIVSNMRRAVATRDQQRIEGKTSLKIGMGFVVGEINCVETEQFLKLAKDTGVDFVNFTARLGKGEYDSKILDTIENIYRKVRAGEFGGIAVFFDDSFSQYLMQKELRESNDVTGREAMLAKGICSVASGLLTPAYAAGAGFVFSCITKAQPANSSDRYKLFNTRQVALRSVKELMEDKKADLRALDPAECEYCRKADKYINEIITAIREDAKDGLKVSELPIIFYEDSYLRTMGIGKGGRVDLAGSQGPALYHLPGTKTSSSGTGPALFVDPDGTVRELSQDEHKELNPKLAEIVGDFDNPNKGVEKLSLGKTVELCGQTHIGPDKNRGPPVSVYVIDDEKLPEKFQNGLITHAGTFKGKAYNLFIPRSVYNVLLILTPAELQIWRNHEVGHLLDRTANITPTEEEKEVAKKIYEAARKAPAPATAAPQKRISPLNLEKMPAGELLSALGLKDPRSIEGADIIGETEEYGYTRQRISVREQLDLIQPPRGISILQRELANPDVLRIKEFDLIYNKDGHLIAVFPVLAPGMKPSADDLKYFDFSYYYFEIPSVKDSDARAKWTGFARSREADASLIEDYKTRHGLDGIEMVGKHQSPYIYIGVKGDMENGWDPTEIIIDDPDNIFLPEPEDGMEQIIIPVFPTVYSPAHWMHKGGDKRYYDKFYEGSQLAKGQDILIIGPGTGCDTWLAWLKTRNKMFAVGYNPLEIANLRATAGIAGFEVEAVVGDNIIDEEGRPRFGERKFDRVSWNMPAYNQIYDVEKPGQVIRSLSEAWDGDKGGVILRRFAKGLPEVLKRGSGALSRIWNQSTYNPDIDMIMETGGARNTTDRPLEVEWKNSAYIIKLKGNIQEKIISAQGTVSGDINAIRKMLGIEGEEEKIVEERAYSNGIYYRDLISFTENSIITTTRIEPAGMSGMTTDGEGIRCFYEHEIEWIPGKTKIVYRRTKVTKKEEVSAKETVREEFVTCVYKGPEARVKIGLKDGKPFLVMNDNALEYFRQKGFDIRRREDKPYLAMGCWGAVPEDRQIAYVDKNETLFKEMLGEGKEPVLLRVPVQGLEAMAVENARDFLEAFQKAPNAYVELFSTTGSGEVNAADYQKKYGFEKKSLPEGFMRTRKNTITLFAASKDENIDKPSIDSRLGSIGMKQEDTLLSPIILGCDEAGLVRATIFGLKMLEISKTRQNKTREKLLAEVLMALLDYKNACDPGTPFEFSHKEVEDILGLIEGNINRVVAALKKLLQFLPAKPIDGAALIRHAIKVMTAA
ncbi:MAG: radical SAM protein [Candidatus Omnitrophica bacterium]|nr:radical SAM protein [Candidatus Omnitrophota bacterium]